MSRVPDDPELNIFAGIAVYCGKFAAHKRTLYYDMERVSDTTALSPILLTEGAVAQLTLIRQQENIPDDHYLRVGVKGGGCSGFTYVLGFDTPQDNDDMFEINGVRVVMNKAHAIYLLGMEVDFVAGLENRGFKFNNPNATSTCGCGTSFSA